MTEIAVAAAPSCTALSPFRAFRFLPHLVGCPRNRQEGVERVYAGGTSSGLGTVTQFFQRKLHASPLRRLWGNRTPTEITMATPEGLARTRAARLARWTAKSLAERFWEKVEQRGPDECWPWTASRYRFGYGALRVDGRTLKSHRLAYKLTKGPIPPGLSVLHSCDNAPCCNPNHLRVGTKLDNARDMVLRDRCSKLRIFGRTKSFCVRGHPFNDANTRVGNDGIRYCRPCARIRTAEYRQRQREAQRMAS